VAEEQRYKARGELYKEMIPDSTDSEEGPHPWRRLSEKEFNKMMDKASDPEEKADMEDW